MANRYTFRMKIAGEEKAVTEINEIFHDRYEATWNLVSQDHIKDLEGGAKIVCGDLTGECGEPLAKDIKEIAAHCKRLGLVLEAFGNDTKEQVQEHILVDRGEIMAATKEPYKAAENTGNQYNGDGSGSDTSGWN